MSRPASRLLIAVAAVLVLAALVLAADWWIALPPGETAHYVGRQACVECHEEEAKLWTGSDHDLAMDRATPETVLGDFSDAEFLHVAFQEVGRLSDADLGALLAEVEPRQLAVALHGAEETLTARIVGCLSDEAAAALERERETLFAVRPCDVTDAQQAIDDVARRLEAESKITVDFAVRSKLVRRGDEFLVTTDNAAGEMETFPVKYVFGVRPLQQYLVEFPDGRIQCLPIAWDTERKAWFHLYPGEPIPHDDQLHWTGRYQNWNYMCAECHTTNLRKNYDLETNTYHTEWSEIDVSCETCHGPGSLHVKLANQVGVFWDRRYGYGLPNLKSETNPQVEIETCAPCHARRRIVYPGCWAGRPLLDHYIPELLDGELYYPDGQILEEDYVYGSFIQSRMYREKVRCTDCHDPHTAKVKFPDNRLCNQCHVAATYDTVNHHHHPDATKPGTLCVECHMPESTYMVADPRRDHSLRVPRPDLTVSLDIPNACNLCHNDPEKGETAQWAVDKCREWYADPNKPAEPPHFAHAFAAGRRGEPEAQIPLAEIARRKNTSAMVRASAIALLGRYGTGRGQAAAFRGLEDPDPLVRAASVRSLQNLPPGELTFRAGPLLRDPIRAVRTEAARVLSAVPAREMNHDDRAALQSALAEYMEAQEAVDDQPAAHLNMAVIYANQGKAEEAVRAYETALRLDPNFVPARINLAMLQYELGDRAEAEAQFRRVIELEPKMAEPYYSLGLMLGEDPDRAEETADLLAAAARLAPDNPRMQYNAGLAMSKVGRPEEAEKLLLGAAKLSPRSADFLYALVDFYSKRQEWGRAVEFARRLTQLEPGNPQWPAVLDHVRQMAGQAGDPE